MDEDWRDLDADALRRRVVREVPLLRDAEHYFVTATVTRNSRHPLGRVIGDGLVLTPSGSGRARTRRIGFDVDKGMHVASAHHFTSLNHAAVYRALRTWLASESAESDEVSR